MSPFEKWWPEFEAEYGRVDLAIEKPAKKESDGDRLEKIEEALSQLILEARSARKTADYDTMQARQLSEAERVRRDALFGRTQWQDISTAAQRAVKGEMARAGIKQPKVR